MSGRAGGAGWWLGCAAVGLALLWGAALGATPGGVSTPPPTYRPKPSPTPQKQGLAPVLVKVPQNVSHNLKVLVLVDTNYTLSCEAEGTQPITIRWQKNYDTLKRRGNYYRITNRGTKLVIKRMMASMEASYRCIATNDYGSAGSMYTLLAVQAPVTFFGQLQSERVPIGHNYTLSCQIFAIPKANITWTRNGQQVMDPVDSSQLYSNRTLNFVVNETAEYTCTGENHHIRPDRQGMMDTKKSSTAVITAFDPYRQGYCGVYNGSECSRYVGSGHMVWYNISYKWPLSDGERLVARLRQKLLTDTTSECQPRADQMLCQMVFPKCAHVGDGKRTARPTPICSEDCDIVQKMFCSMDWASLNRDLAQESPRLHLPNCKLLPSKIGNSSSCSRIDFQLQSIPTESTLPDGPIGGTATTEEGMKSWMDNIKEFFTFETILVFVGAGLVSILLLTLIIGLSYRIYSRHGRWRYNPTPQLDLDIDLNRLTSNSMYHEQAPNWDGSQSLNKMEYPRNDIVYIQDIGKGAFGRVFQAQAPNITQEEEMTMIAVKVLMEEATTDMQHAFEREAMLMADLSHPQIVQLLGVCAIGKPMCLLFEHMCRGDLNEFLKNCSPRHFIVRNCSSEGLHDHAPELDEVEQLYIGEQVASGMVYLAERGYVHRDLATRNCLVGEDLTVKISDFGLTRHVGEDGYYEGSEQDAVPIRWLPLESIISNKFSWESDVWSFGVLLWEVFSFALQPYYGMTLEEVIKYLRDGKVLMCPDNTPDEVYDVMRKCWSMEPQDPPQFSTLHHHLTSLKANFTQRHNMNSS